MKRVRVWYSYALRKETSNCPIYCSYMSVPLDVWAKTKKLDILKIIS